MKIPPHSLFSHTLTLASFAAIQAAQFVCPLIALPWLGRVLGPDAFGLLMYMSILPPIVALFMDWGLTLGGARLAARQRGHHRRLSVLIGAVFSAKIILALACLACGACAMYFLPHATDWPLAYFLAISLGICRGLSPLWFFQGTGHNAQRMAIFDVSASFLALGLVFIFIHSPSAWPLYLLFLTVCKAFAYFWLNAQIWHGYMPRLGLRAGWRMLGKTRALFANSLAVMVYNNGSQLVMAFFLPPTQMGMIVAANKILRAAASIVNPLTQTLFPEICARGATEPDRTRMLLRRSLIGSFFLMLCVASFIWLYAGGIIALALGPQYREAAQILRIMILAAPFMACNYVLGAQMLVPFGQEKGQLAVQGIMGALSLPLAAAASLIFGVQGAAALPALIECGMFFGLLSAIRSLCPRALFAAR